MMIEGAFPFTIPTYVTGKKRLNTEFFISWNYCVIFFLYHAITNDTVVRRREGGKKVARTKHTK